VVTPNDTQVIACAGGNSEMPCREDAESIISPPLIEQLAPELQATNPSRTGRLTNCEGSESVSTINAVAVTYKTLLENQGLAKSDKGMSNTSKEEEVFHTRYEGTTTPPTTNTLSQPSSIMLDSMAPSITEMKAKQKLDVSLQLDSLPIDMHQTY
jgi:hypothetical protein